jgi:sigma-54 dependent transcriptional regulator, acetoin dehydrogenase operon transcriptional activator AcoR
MVSMIPFHAGPTTGGQDRLARIGRARQAVLYGEARPADTVPFVESWIESSWRRCLAGGQRPERAPSFDTVPAAEMRRHQDANHHLVQAAKPTLERLGRAIADTRYFAILTNQAGVVVDVNGRIDRGDSRADVITRIGTDLSEPRVGTTAIGAALAELQPVWLHRGEHFFDATSVYSCAGAPLFGPDGHCAGMLDLTGIEAAERPELKHLVSQCARSIENALTLGRPHALLIRLNWPGRALGDDTDGLLCVDADGGITGANPAARQMLPRLDAADGTPHCGDLFAMPFEMLFDAARRPSPANGGALEAPLWSGLRLHALPLPAGRDAPPTALQLPPSGDMGRPLKELETALIRKAVSDARGNVLQAAKALGVSRATVYRRLGPGKRG